MNEIGGEGSEWRAKIPSNWTAMWVGRCAIMNEFPPNCCIFYESTMGKEVKLWAEVCWKFVCTAVGTHHLIIRFSQDRFPSHSLRCPRGCGADSSLEPFCSTQLSLPVLHTWGALTVLVAWRNDTFLLTFSSSAASWLDISYVSTHRAWCQVAPVTFTDTAPISVSLKAEFTSSTSLSV